MKIDFAGRARGFDIIRQVREGRLEARTVGERATGGTWAEHTLRIHEADYYALLKIFPKLNARDPHEQAEEWERFFKSDFALRYRVARTPNQVQRSIKAALGRR